VGLSQTNKKVLKILGSGYPLLYCCGFVLESWRKCIICFGPIQKLPATLLIFDNICVSRVGSKMCVSLLWQQRATVLRTRQIIIAREVK